MTFDYRIADISLAAEGRTAIRIAESEMPGLMELRRRYSGSKPLAGVRIAGSLGMTVETAVLIETLIELGADLRWATCNVLSTMDHAAAAIVVGRDGTPDEPRGIPVFAWMNQTLDEYWWCHAQALRWPDGTGPDFIQDDGGDATLLLHESVKREKAGTVPDPTTAHNAERAALLRFIAGSMEQDAGRWTGIAVSVRGVAEETMTGIRALRRLADSGELMFPGINVNDAITKTKLDNIYGCRHSLIDGLNRATDRMISGRTGVVVGYGDVGKGCVSALSGLGARVIVVEVDPISALQAALDGYEVTTLEVAAPRGDIFITAAANCEVIRPQHMERMKHLAILGNMGHSDVEVDVAALAEVPGIRKRELKPQVDEWIWPDGRSLLVLSQGRDLNFGNATGHPAFIMSASFTNQALALLELANNRGQYPIGVHNLPRKLDEEVARLHLDALGVRLSRLTPKQAEYAGVPVDGPYKREEYRY
ncbi:adenosylhomocysteinase [Streptomyces sp. NBC_01408]|uniref:adenosylhomocysteinase n=1 Tax=Streptomyces sp. NBC_01408 TaxID=2903855 RepID=UPI002252586D|nr:adenosylhomocysteinase [Streptomyces sp. NBC_01408]MCX4692893.1 adenosylhomocysteinase [Streptomyces sp. NBC_01408]